jgi:L-ascorbate metabolism protein UlaG (beta-lactamase superfamily)
MLLAKLERYGKWIPVCRFRSATSPPTPYVMQEIADETGKRRSMMTRRNLLGLLATLPFLGGSVGAARASSGSFYYNGPISDHFDGQRFFNPGSEAGPRGFGDFLRWKIGEPRTPWPDEFPSPYRDEPPLQLDPRSLRVALVGHATFLIQIGGLAILTDPVWSQRASPFRFAGPRRYNDPGIAFNALPRIDAVVISHCHYDHLDLDTLARLWQRDRPRIVAPLGNAAIIQAQHPDIAVESVDWGDAVRLDGPGVAGATITTEPAHHWSARGVSDRNHALWASYVIRSANRAVYFAGDCGFGGGRNFRAIAARHPRLDIALLPIGAYEPRWFMKEQHMNPDDAVEAFKILDPRRAIGFHWGTFRLTNEGVDEPVKDLDEALARHRVGPDRFVAAWPGQAWEV